MWQIFSVLVFCSIAWANPTPPREYELICDAKECVLDGSVPIRERNIIEEDMIIDDEELDIEGRAVVKAADRKWPKAVVPYVFHKVFSADQRRAIEEAMRTIESRTCIRFKAVDPKNPPKTYVSIVDEKGGCSAFVGHRSSKKQIVVNYNRKSCFRTRGTLQHELIHALGAQHEQSRPDRDKYVKIDTLNIKPDHMRNFVLNSASDYTTFGLPYNYESVMHYSAYAFAIDRSKKTIIPRDPRAPASDMGQRIGMNNQDYQMLNLLYCKK